jgi:hypothetical protein
VSTKKITTAEELKLEAIRQGVTGSAQGDAGGWHFVLTAPNVRIPKAFVSAAKQVVADRARSIDIRPLVPHLEDATDESDATTENQWWLSCKRNDRRPPSKVALDFAKRFAIAMGAPATIEPWTPIVGTFYFRWSASKAGAS